jgi:integrase
MSYPDKRKDKDGNYYFTGSFVGEAPKLGKKRRFKLDRDAKDYETFCKLMGREPPTIEEGMGSTGAPTFAMVAKLCKEAGGPKGKWVAEKDKSVIQRLDYCVTVIGSYEIQRVTRAVLKQILDDLDARPKAPGKRRDLITNATKNRYLSAAHAVLTYARNEEILLTEPPAAPYLDEETSRKERDILQLGQDEVVLQIMRDRGQLVDALCVEMLIETGLRSGELLKKLGPDQITIEQVEDEDGTLVPVGVLRLHKGQVKNNTRRLSVFSAELAKQIRALIATESLPDGWQLLRRFKSACEAAGYTGNLVIHSLRHTRNTRLRKAGISQKIRKEMLGHMSDEVNDGYDHTDLQDHLQVVKKVQEYAGKRAKNGSVPKVVEFKKAL